MWLWVTFAVKEATSPEDTLDTQDQNLKIICNCLHTYIQHKYMPAYICKAKCVCVCCCSGTGSARRWRKDRSARMAFVCGSTTCCAVRCCACGSVWLTWWPTSPAPASCRSFASRPNCTTSKWVSVHQTHRTPTASRRSHARLQTLEDPSQSDLRFGMKMV